MFLPPRARELSRRAVVVASSPSPHGQFLNHLRVPDGAELLRQTFSVGDSFEDVDPVYGEFAILRRVHAGRYIDAPWSLLMIVAR